MIFKKSFICLSSILFFASTGCSEKDMSYYTNNKVNDARFGVYFNKDDVDYTLNTNQVINETTKPTTTTQITKPITTTQTTSVIESFSSIEEVFSTLQLNEDVIETTASTTENVIETTTSTNEDVIETTASTNEDVIETTASTNEDVIETTASTTENVIETTTSITEVVTDSTLTTLVVNEETMKNEYSDSIEEETEPQEYEYSWENHDGYWYFQPSGWVLSDKDWYALCNCVANEAGSGWVTDYDKALVCEVIFNRLYDWGYNSVYDVIAAPGQFTGSHNYVDIDGYYYKVNTCVINACAFYCSWPEIFNEGYHYFVGDNYANYFSQSWPVF